MNFSSSAAKSSLRTLNIDSSLISDVSKDCWSKFSALSRVNVSKCRTLGVKTLQSIVKLPQLVELVFDESFATAIVPLLPARIQVLDIRSDGSAEMDIAMVQDIDRSRSALSVLASRGRLEQLTSLSFFNQYGEIDEIDQFKQLRTNYPKLEHLGARVRFEELQRSVSSFANLRSLSLAFGGLKLTTNHIKSLSRECPELLSLYIELYFAESGVDLSSLARLESLQIVKLMHLEEIKAWPPSLRSLQIKDCGISTDVAEKQEFLRVLGQSCPALKEFKLAGRIYLDTLAILETFPLLEALVMPDRHLEPPTPPPGSKIIHHPHIRQLKATSELLETVLFPRLEKLSVYDAVTACTHLTAPLLRAVELTTTRACSDLSRFLSVRALTVRGGVNQQNAQLQLGRFFCLSSLKLTLLCAANSAIISLLPDLKMLQHLDIATVAADVSTIAHPSLLSLKLRVGGRKIIISPENLPELQNLVIIPRDEIWLEASHMRQLRTIAIICDEFDTYAASLTISHCHNLQSIHFVSVSIQTESSFIADCPRLTRNAAIAGLLSQPNSSV